MAFPQLTFTRFLAAFGVLVFHHISDPDIFPFNEPILRKIFSSGGSAVHYFFVLSGFIMMAAYGKNNTIDKKKYWLLRFVRIYPTYFLGIVLMVLINAVPPLTELSLPAIKTFLKTIFSQSKQIDFRGLFLNLTLLQSWSFKFWQTINPPNWSLSVEAFFYFCFPFLLPIIQFKNNRQVLFSFLFVSFIACLVGLSVVGSTHEIFFYGSPFLSFSSFGLGIIAFKIYEIFEKKKLRNWFPILVALLGSMVVIALILIDDSGYVSAYTLSPIFCVIIVGIALDKSAVAKLFSTSFLVELGEISFAIYIYQTPVYVLLQRLNVISSPTLNTPSFYLYLLLLSLFAFLSYRLVESPIRNYAKAKLKNPTTT